jgi:hypothetical protein
VRLGGQYAPLQALIGLPSASGHGTLVVHDGGMSAITLAVNGHTFTLAAGDPNTPLTPFGDTRLDLGPYLHAGVNSISAVGTPARAGGAAVLSFFG